MERMGTCGVCKFYKAKVDYTDSSEGSCFESGVKWTTSRDTCRKHEEHREIAIMELQQGIEEVQVRLQGFRQRIADCKARIVEDTDLIRQVEPREKELQSELEKRGVVEDDDDD